jgi:hypothetical protein
VVAAAGVGQPQVAQGGHFGEEVAGAAGGGHRLLKEHQRPQGLAVGGRGQA